MRITRFDTLGEVGIVSTSHFLPERRMATRDLFAEDAALADELDRLTGIRERPVADPAHATSDLAIHAARPLPDLERVSSLILATMSPDYVSPATAPLVQHALGLPGIPASDIVAACAGYVYALDAAARAALTGDDRVLVIAAELRSRILASAAPGVRCLFGDGASAAVVGRSPCVLRLLATATGADGAGHSAVRIEAGGTRVPTSHRTIDDNLHTLRMEDGPMVFFKAVEGFVEIAEALLQKVGMCARDFDWIVPHQANLRILERVARALRVPIERFVVTVETTGNVGGASVGIALDRALKDGRIRPGNRVLLLTAGAGFTAGAAILERTDVA